MQESIMGVKGGYEEDNVKIEEKSRVNIKIPCTYQGQRSRRNPSVTVLRKNQP